MNEENKKSTNYKKLLLILGAIFIGLIILCCCCIFTLTASSGRIFEAMLFDDNPTVINVEKWSDSEIENLQDEIKEEIRENNMVTLTGEEMTQLIMSGESSNETQAKVEILDQDILSIQFSIVSEDKKDE